MISTRSTPKPFPWQFILFGCVIFWIKPAEAQVAVQIGQNFTGSTYSVNTAASPADSNGAIGPRHFMEFINGTVAVYNKTNGMSVQRKTNLKFWSDAGVIISADSAVSDPRVIYDPSVQRWFALQIDFDYNAAANGLDYLTEQNDFLFAVSATSDPTGQWRGFLFQSDPDTGGFADFPTLGVDANAVYLAGDFFRGETVPLGSGLVSIPKTDLLASTPTVANRTWFGLMSHTNRGQVLQPAICFDGSSSGNILAMGDIGNDSDPHSNMVSFAVQNAGSTNPTLTAAASLNVPAYVVPFNSDLGYPLFNPVQPDGTTTLQANDARLSAQVHAVAGSLYAVHNTEFNGRVAIRWYRIGAPNHVVLESGTIADPALDLFFPSIAANTNGTIVVACNGSSMNTFVSCFAVVGQTVNGVTAFGDLVLLKAGVANYHDGNEILAQLLNDPVVDSRWGDYSATSVDPSDPTHFWTIQMYASGESESVGIWSTQVTELLTIASPTLSITRSGPDVVVSWPVASGGFNLESNTNIASTNSWTPITSTFSTNNGRVQFQTSLTNQATFFRLRK